MKIRKIIIATISMLLLTGLSFSQKKDEGYVQTAYKAILNKDYKKAIANYTKRHILEISLSLYFLTSNLT